MSKSIGSLNSKYDIIQERYMVYTVVKKYSCNIHTVKLQYEQMQLETFTNANVDSQLSRAIKKPNAVKIRAEFRERKRKLRDI